MTREIELAALDLRYEGYRMKNPAVEARLLAAIAERGIEEPLEGVDRAPLSILLNGFKRYRCAVKLGMGLAPYASLGAEEAAAILNLLRVSNDHSLSILEQAAFLDQLRKLEQSSVAELAEQLSRSKSWVSMRLGLLAEMSPWVREKIFSGAFPVYPYMYALRQFMRMNGVHKQDIEEFVLALSGKKLSVRDRLLDPCNVSLTLDTITRAARVLGKRVHITRSLKIPALPRRRRVKATGQRESPSAQNEGTLNIFYHRLAAFHQLGRTQRPVIFKELHATHRTFNQLHCLTKADANREIFQCTRNVPCKKTLIHLVRSGLVKVGLPELPVGQEVSHVECGVP